MKKGNLQKKRNAMLSTGRPGQRKKRNAMLSKHRNKVTAKNEMRNRKRNAIK